MHKLTAYYDQTFEILIPSINRYYECDLSELPAIISLPQFTFTPIAESI